jgi:hypothetical protein
MNSSLALFIGVLSFATTSAHAASCGRFAADNWNDLQAAYTMGEEQVFNFTNTPNPVINQIQAVLGTSDFNEVTFSYPADGVYRQVELSGGNLAAPVTVLHYRNDPDSESFDSGAVFEGRSATVLAKIRFGQLVDCQ